MEIKVGFEISYYAVNPTPMVTMLNIHPSRFADIVGTETVIAESNGDGPACRSDSIATVSAMSAAGSWRRPAA